VETSWPHLPSCPQLSTMYAQICAQMVKSSALAAARDVRNVPDAADADHVPARID